MRTTLARWWYVFADRLGAFLEELIFRVGLAFNILVGRVPQRTDKRAWIRSVETPVKVDCYDWINDRLVFSVLIWPVLAAPPDEAYSRHDELVEAVLDAIAKGAAEKMWSIYWEVDYGLTWDHSRKCWVDGDGHSYDGSRFERMHR